MDERAYEHLREAIEARTELFRRHEFEEVFAILDEDTVWERHMGGESPVILHGREEVVAEFDEMVATLPDWTTEVSDVVVVDDSTVLVEYLGRGSGAHSGAPATMPFSQLWKTREGKVTWVGEYIDLAEGRRAAGIEG